MGINKNEIRQRFLRSKDTYEKNASIQRSVAAQVYALVVENLKEEPRAILEIGCGTGLLTGELVARFDKNTLYVNDLVNELCQETLAKYGIPVLHGILGDIEEESLPCLFDLVVSASTFQWFNQPEETIKKIAQHLKSNGLLIFSTYGKYNLREIRLTTGGGLAYRTQDSMMDILESYFRVEKTLEEFRLLEFNNPLEILLHLKRTGVNVSGSQTIWTKGKVQAFIDEYNARFAMDGRVTLTYHPLYFVCRKK